MAARERFAHRPTTHMKTTPFVSAEEAWFWFMQAQQARLDGARIMGGQGALARPCEAADIFKIVDRLYRQRRLMRDHLLVLRHYGRRFLAPDPRRAKEARAHALWTESLERIGAVLESRGIMRPSPKKSTALSAVNILPRQYLPETAWPVMASAQSSFYLEGVAAE